LCDLETSRQGGLDLIWAVAPERERVKLCIGFPCNLFAGVESSIRENDIPSSSGL